MFTAFIIITKYSSLTCRTISLQSVQTQRRVPKRESLLLLSAPDGLPLLDRVQALLKSPILKLFSHYPLTSQ